ncbi:PTS system, mannitol-specific EIIA component [Klebsiella variicola]|nr:PTS system, mannitol-specific EIIA component [Klebsiella variicola]
MLLSLSLVSGHVEEHPKDDYTSLTCLYGVLMITELLTEERIAVVDDVSDWQSAIALAVAPLIADGTVRESYLQAIIESTFSNGPYYVLAPGIAMPHARPETGVNQNGLAFLLVKNGVNFPDQADPVKLHFLLAARDPHQHIALITQLSELFCSETDLDALFNANDVAEVLKVISRY